MIDRSGFDRCLRPDSRSIELSSITCFNKPQVQGVTELKTCFDRSVVVGVQNGKVYFLSGKNGAYILDPYQIGGSVNSVAYLNDVTGDSVPEILAGGSDRSVYCLTTLLTPKVDTKIAVSFTPNPASTSETVELQGVLKSVTGIFVYPAQVRVEYSIKIDRYLNVGFCGSYRTGGDMF